MIDKDSFELVRRYLDSEGGDEAKTKNKDFGFVRAALGEPLQKVADVPEGEAFI